MYRKLFIATSMTLLISATVIGVACSGAPTTAVPTRTFKGAKIGVGQGNAWVEMTVGKGNEVEGLALVFTPEALLGLPPTLPATEFIIPLPSQAPATVFNHVGVNWQPQGHQPAGIYSVPHFDVHFYLISSQERDAMTPADPAFAMKALRVPDAADLPTGFTSDPMPIPRMGSHWADPNSHEFHGSPFTSTLIYGFYDAKMVFIEPMMAKSFVESNPDFSASMMTPAAYPKAGRYPTGYSVAYDASAKEYRVKLASFVNRN